MAVEASLAEGIGRLIHAYHEGSDEAEAHADEALARWLKAPDATLSIFATEVQVDGVVELSGTDALGQWILPVFMAGLREIRLGPETDASDFMRLAEELADIDASSESIEHLREWLWMDGAEGFRIELESSFTDALDAAFVDPESAKQQLMTMRAEAAMSFSPDSLSVASRDLDAAAHREEFQMSVDALTESAGSGQWNVDEDARKTLARSCDSAAFWVKSQVDFGLSHPNLQASISPRKLSRTLIKEASDQADAGLIEVVAEVTQRTDPFTGELTTVLDREAVGEAIAKTLRPDDDVMKALGTLLSGTRSRLAQEVAHGILDRAAVEPDLVEPATTLVTSLGINRFWGQVDLETLPSGSTGTLTRIMPRCDPSPAIVKELLRHPQTGGPLIGSIPAESLLKQQGELEKFLMEAAPEHVEPVVQSLASSDNPDVVKMVGRTLLQTGGEGWRKSTLDAALTALVGAGLADEYVIPLAQDRKADWQSRLTAFRALAKDPPTFQRAVKFRAGEVGESKEVKRWLKAARKAGGLPKVGKAKGGGLGFFLLLTVVAAAAVAVAYGAYVMNRDELTPQQTIERFKGTFQEKLEGLTGGADADAGVDAEGEADAASDEGGAS